MCRNETRTEFRFRKIPGFGRKISVSFIPYCRNRHPIELSAPPPSYAESRPLRQSSAGLPSAPPCYRPVPTSIGHAPCRAGSQVGYQGHHSFLDAGTAAVCGPGLSMARPTLQSCCQDQAHHSHDLPHQVTQSLPRSSRLQSWPQLQRSHGH